MELTSESLFQSGEFKLQFDRELDAKHGIKCYPNQIWWSPASKTAVGCCFRSPQGEDFSLSRSMLQLLRRLEDEGRVAQAYVATCRRRNGGYYTKPEVLSHCTLAQQEQKLDNVEPRSGQRGEYYWVNKNGDPAPLSKPQYHDDDVM